MRRRFFGLIVGALALAAGIFATDPPKTPHPAEDIRPFGKYLVRVCELGRGCYDPAEACKPSCAKEIVPPNQGANTKKATAPASQGTDTSKKASATASNGSDTPQTPANSGSTG